MATPVPSSGSTIVRFPEISPTAWEHPTDRAAMQALRSIPVFDTVVRKVIGAIGERNIRLMFSAQSIEVGPNQYSDVHELLEQACASLDCPVPQLFVSQSPFADAGALGVDRPFIVLNSSVVELASPKQLTSIIGANVGAILSEHTLYRTVLFLLLNFSGGTIPRQAVTPILLALLEWQRKSMISNDRAGLLVSQDLEASIGALALIAGGIRGRSTDIDIQAVRDQSGSYHDSNGLDVLFKFMGSAFRSDPFPMMRVRQLDLFVDSVDYAKIARGDYVRRGEEAPLSDDLARATAGFSESAEEVFTNADDYVNKALNNWIDGLRAARDSFGSDDDGSTR